MINAAIDHLVVTAPSLAAGTTYIRDQLGVEMQPGGTHPAMGTHNLLLKLDDSTYLEVLAIDPEVTAPGSPRWFDLDRVTAPALATWVARVDDIHAAASALGIPEHNIKPMSRGALQWLITIPDDGSLSKPPVLIQWLNGPHPAPNLRDTGCFLTKLDVQLAVLSPLTLDPRCSAGSELIASIRTPQGLRSLRQTGDA
jgi:hypothetical protein